MISICYIGNVDILLWPETPCLLGLFSGGIVTPRSWMPFKKKLFNAFTLVIIFWFLIEKIDFILFTHIQIVSCIDCPPIFTPLMAYNCYLTLGPFSIGYFVPQQIGASFSFGLYTGGAYIEEATTYLYVAIHLLWFTSVTMFCVGEILLRGGGGGRGGAGPLSLRGAGFKLLWCFVVVVQLYSMNSYRMAYGWLASGTNLVSTWSLVFFVYLISKAGRISRLSNTSPARRPVN